MWNDLIFSNQAMLRALETAGIKLNPPVHIIKAGKSHLSSKKVIFYIFNNNAATPELILKVGRNPGDLQSMQREFDSQNLVWQSTQPDPMVARPVGLFDLPGLPVIFEAWLPGVSILRLYYLRKHIRPDQVQKDLSTIVNQCLIPFQIKTASGYFSGDPAEMLAQQLQTLQNKKMDFRINGEQEKTLFRLAEHCAGKQLPLVGSHGDFWPGNILIHKSSYKLLDWEAYQPQALPYDDFFFFLTNCAMAYPWKSWKHQSSREGFLKGFLQNNWFSEIIQSCIRDFNTAHGLDGDGSLFYFCHFLLKTWIDKAERSTFEAHNRDVWKSITTDFFAHFDQFQTFFQQGRQV